MEDEGHIAGFCLNLFEHVKSEPGPVSGIFAVNIAYARGKNCHAEVGDPLALVGVGTLAETDNAVFLAAD